MGSRTEPPKPGETVAELQNTPTRAPKLPIPEKNYQFTFSRQQSLQLSPDAKQLMNEKREEAARIREQMVADEKTQRDTTMAIARKIATPKRTSGRYSQIHSEQFKKMTSIAGHASSFRANPEWKKTAGSPVTSEQHPSRNTPSYPKSLKRSPSKAKLDDPESPTPAVQHSSASKQIPHSANQLPRGLPMQAFPKPGERNESSPAKRLKLFQNVDSAKMQSFLVGREAAQANTPSAQQHLRTPPGYPTLFKPEPFFGATPPRPSGSKTVKGTKIPAPSNAHSPAKLAAVESSHASQKGHSAKKTPVKGVSAATDPNSPGTSVPLLSRSPTKASLFTKSAAKDATPNKTSLLSRSPVRCPMLKDPDDASESRTHKADVEALLARSPLKKPSTKSADSEARSEESSWSTPLLARPPEKIAHAKMDSTSQSSQTPNPARSLAGRFNLLRASPIKSILRSPQRLYSADPVKVAAGTHLATPPKKRASEINKSLIAASASARKRVDFSSSTKDRYERAQSETTGRTPSKNKASAELDCSHSPSSAQPIAAYPTLPSTEFHRPTPQQRVSSRPNDFTFRAGNSIVFAESPSAPPSMSGNKRPSTIRHVSVDMHSPPAGRKKRKFEFENEQATSANMEGTASDKENPTKQDEQRPSKRVKQSFPSPAFKKTEMPAKKPTRPPTLGVRPMGTTKARAHGIASKEKKPTTTISQVRLNALSQPKKKG